MGMPLRSNSTLRAVLAKYCQRTFGAAADDLMSPVRTKRIG